MIEPEHDSEEKGKKQQLHQDGDQEQLEKDIIEQQQGYSIFSKNLNAL